MDNMTNSSLLDVGKYINWTENETVVIDHPVYSDPMAYLIITQTICVLGTLLNCLIIIVIVYGSLMRTSVFMILLLVLAVFDNLALWSVSLAKGVIYSLLPFSPSLWLCQTFTFVIYLSGLVSSWLVVFISAERLMAVFLPFKVHIYCTRRNSCYAISIIIIVMCIISLPIVFTCKIGTMGGAYVFYGFYILQDLSILPSLFLTLIIRYTFFKKN